MPRTPIRTVRDWDCTSSGKTSESNTKQTRRIVLLFHFAEHLSRGFRGLGPGDAVNADKEKYFRLILRYKRNHQPIRWGPGRMRARCGARFHQGLRALQLTVNCGTGATLRRLPHPRE